VESSNNYDSDINRGKVISPSQENGFINVTIIFSEINILNQSFDEKKAEPGKLGKVH
jgi:hypothetical protein